MVSSLFGVNLAMGVMCADDGDVLALNSLPMGFSHEEMLLNGAEGAIAPLGQQQRQQQQELGLDGAVMDEVLERRIQNVYDLNEIKGVLRELSLDLRQEPGFSQLIFSHLLEKHTNIEDLYTFLKDPSLNVNGAGNFLYLVEYLRAYETPKKERHGYFTLMHQALRLGLIPPEEIALIIKLTPGIRIGTGTLKTLDPGSLAFCYKSMWDGIEACSILGSKDLGERTLNLWLGEIAETSPDKAILLLGAQIIRKLVAFSDSSDCCRWVPVFMAQWMSLPTNSVVKDVGSKPWHWRDVQTEENFRYISSLLDLFNPELKVKYIIDVTEFLAFSLRGGQPQPKILEGWKRLLPRFENPWAMLSSPSWTDIESLSSGLTVSPELNFEALGFYAHHRCLLRIWTVRSLGTWYMRAKDKNINGTILNQREKVLVDLITQFDILSSKWDDSDIFTMLIHSFQDMQLPFRGIMALAARQQTGKYVRPRMVKIFRGLEEGTTDLTEVFSDFKTYTKSKPYLFRAFERMVCNTDVTTASFALHGIRIAEKDEEGRSALLRLLRRHTPLKIALSKSRNNPDSSLPPEWIKETAAPHSSPPPSTPFPPPTSSLSESSTPASSPSPIACLELIHFLSLAFACSKLLSPRTSYRLVYWCYVFLVSHEAPIKPVMVRALYHAGVTRYREEGWKINTGRFQYITKLVEKVEGADVADRSVRRSRNG